MQNRSVRTAVSAASLLVGMSLGLGPILAHAGTVTVTVDPASWTGEASAGLSEQPQVVPLSGGPLPATANIIVTEPSSSGGVTITGAFPSILVAASSADITTTGGASGSLTFYFELIANPLFGGTTTGIPILMNGTSSQSLKGSDGSGSTAVGMTIEALTGNPGSLFDLNTANNGVFTGNFSIVSGVEYEVDMFARVNVSNGAASALIDPMFVVDPNFNDPNNFNFLFSDGITNGINSAATPLPAALPLFGAGLGVFGLFARRKKWKRTATLAAA